MQQVKRPAHTHTPGANLLVTGGRVRWARPPKQPQGRPSLRHDGKCGKNHGCGWTPWKCETECGGRVFVVTRFAFAQLSNIMTHVEHRGCSGLFVLNRGLRGNLGNSYRVSKLRTREIKPVNTTWPNLRLSLEDSTNSMQLVRWLLWNGAI